MHRYLHGFHNIRSVRNVKFLRICNHSSQFNLDDYLIRIESNIQKIMARKTVTKYKYIDILEPATQNIKNPEILRTKQTQMKYGEIWQMVLGEYDGFENLKQGHNTGLDILSTRRKVIIELKNRYNTDNASSRKTNLDKLAKYKREHPDYECIYGVINDKTREGQIKSIRYSDDVEITYLSGMKLLDYCLEKNTEPILDLVKRIVNNYRQY